MDLSENQRRYLRGRAHALKPIIQIGNKGLTEPWPRKPPAPCRITN